MNISQDFLDALPTAPPMSLAADRAAAELHAGHRAGYYTLPANLVHVMDGTEDLARRVAEVGAALSGRFDMGWEGTIAGELAGSVRGEAWATGSVPPDPAAALLAAQDEHRRLAAELSILSQASASSESAPETVARQNAGAIAKALETARAEVLQAAAEPASHIAGLDLGDPGALLGAPKPAQSAYQALTALLPRYHAILAGAEALRALAPGQAPSWPVSQGGHPVAELAAVAAEGREELKS